MQKPQVMTGTHIDLIYILVQNTLLCVLETTDEVWDPYRLLSLVLKSLFCMLKTTGEGWDPYRPVILVQKSLFCMQKPQMRLGPVQNM